METHELLSGEKPVGHELPGSNSHSLVRHDDTSAAPRTKASRQMLKTQATATAAPDSSEDAETEAIPQRSTYTIRVSFRRLS